MDHESPATCHSVREGLTEYLDRALSPSRRQGFDEHFATCAGCRAVLAELGLTLEHLASLPSESMPQALKHSLLDAFRSGRTG